jgi:hypothetical protein
MPMFMLVSMWLDNLRFAGEVQHVVARRLSMLATADRRCAKETVQMVTEKVAACAEAHIETTAAIMTGQHIAVAMERGLRPYRRRVRANSARLGTRR